MYKRQVLVLVLVLVVLLLVVAVVAVVVIVVVFGVGVGVGAGGDDGGIVGVILGCTGHCWRWWRFVMIVRGVFLMVVLL